MTPSLRNFLSLIAWSEGTSASPVTKDDGYDVIVSGVDGPNSFTNYSDHPFANGRPPIVVNHAVPPLRSTASGRYQLLYRWWPAYKKQLSLPDFGHDSQDAVAVQQIGERNALHLIASGNVQAAIEACSSIWASFPGNDYAQAGGRTMQQLLDRYDASAQ